MRATQNCPVFPAPADIRLLSGECLAQPSTAEWVGHTVSAGVLDQGEEQCCFHIAVL